MSRARNPVGCHRCSKHGIATWLRSCKAWFCINMAGLLAAASLEARHREAKALDNPISLDSSLQSVLCSQSKKCFRRKRSVLGQSNMPGRHISFIIPPHSRCCFSRKIHSSPKLALPDTCRPLLVLRSHNTSAVCTFSRSAALSIVALLGLVLVNPAWHSSSLTSLQHQTSTPWASTPPRDDIDPAWDLARCERVYDETYHI
jgi:hypothetical protein